jgi:hypothetical protein
MRSRVSSPLPRLIRPRHPASCPRYSSRNSGSGKPFSPSFPGKGTPPQISCRVPGTHVRVPGAGECKKIQEPGDRLLERTFRLRQRKVPPEAAQAPGARDQEPDYLSTSTISSAKRIILPICVHLWQKN